MISLVRIRRKKDPVTYYGTQIGSTATWNFEIVKDDTETLYGLRRLAAWMGDVYVRDHLEVVMGKCVRFHLVKDIRRSQYL